MIGCIAKPWLLPIAVTMLAVNLASQTKNGVYPTVGRRVGLVELKFPVDAKSAVLRQYNRDVLQDIEEKSYSLGAETARLPLTKKVKVVIDFAILRNGAVVDVKLIETSRDKKLDRAALEAIMSSSPHAALPADFEGERLDVIYMYSSKPGLRMSPLGPVSIRTANSQQFSVGDETVTWAVVGTQCSKSDCGAISASGLYTAPATVPDPSTIRITATTTIQLVDSTYAEVTIIPRTRSK